MPKFTFTGDGRVNMEQPDGDRTERWTEHEPKGRKLTPQERTRAAVYATGNKWAIENFEATHN